MADISVINNVQVTEDENGNMHFEPIKNEQKHVEVDTRSTFQRLCDWWNSLLVKPYIKSRNMSDPFGDRNTEGGEHKAVEVGIKVSF